MATGSIGGIPVPLDTDPVDLTGPTAGDGDLGRMVAAVSGEQTLATTRIADLEANRYARGTVGGGTDFDTVTTPGWYHVNTTTGSSNFPPGATAGPLEVFRSSNGLQAWQRMTKPLASDGEVWQRVANLSSGQWSAWRRIDGPRYQGTVGGGTDFDTLTTPGRYWLSTTTGSTNAPPVSVNGVLEIDVNPANGMQVVQKITTTLATDTAIWGRSANLSSGQWSDWRRLDAPTAPDPTGDALRHRMLADTASARRGGTIGTGGLPVVALRFDHHLTHFETKVLPLLRQYGLPWAQIMNADTWATADNAGMTPAELQTAAQTSGGEVWNHGGNHLDASDEAAIQDQIVGSLDRLTAALPGLPVEGWAPPGLGEGGYDGYTPPNSIDRHTGTYAGQLVLSHHGIVAGYMPGIYHTLDGASRIGLAHTTIDASDPATVASIVDGAVRARAGLALMLHSNYLDQAGYLSTADLETILADLAARRDAGELLVTTYSGLWFADARSGHRHDLLPAVAATTGTYSQTVALNRQPQYAGGTRELVAQVDTSAGATMTLTVDGNATTHTVPAGGGLVRRFVTVPLTATSVVVEIARTAGTEHTVRDVRLLAA